MAKQSRKRAENTLAALAMIATMIGATTASSPAAASDRLARVLAPVMVGAAIYYGMTHSQRAHFYDRSYHFDPTYYYFDEHRGHWRARSHARHNRSHARRSTISHNRRSYSHNPRRDRGHGNGGGHGRSNGDHGRRGH